VGASLALLDPLGAEQANVPLDAAPGPAVSGFGGIWVVEPAKGLLVRVDPSTRRVVTTIPVGSSPTHLTVGSHDLWVGDSADHTLTRVDPRTDSVAQTINVGVDPVAVAEGSGTLFVAGPSSKMILRIDPATGQPRGSLRVPDPVTSLAVSEAGVWAVSEPAGTLTRVDAATGSVTTHLHIGTGPSSLALTHDSAWVLDPLAATLYRVNPLGMTVTGAIPLPGRPTSVVADDNAVWVTDHDHGTVTRVDPGRAIVTGRTSLGRHVISAAVDKGVWAAVAAPVPDHRGGVLHVSTDMAVDSVDPASSTSVNGFPAQLFGLTSDTLVTLNHSPGAAGNRLAPDLALNLPEPLDGGQRYTFHLRPGIHYSTGQLVTPSDVPRSLERLFALNSSGASLYSDVLGANECVAAPSTCDLSRGVIADDDASTVTFQLTRPDPDFLYKLTLFYASVVPADSPRRELHDPPPATGPYVIVNYHAKQDLTLTRNPAFQEWSSAAQPDGYPDTIVIRRSPGDQNAATAIQAGHVDFLPSLAGVGGVDSPPLAATGRARINATMTTGFVALNVNAAPFDDIRARRALNLALDRGRIVQRLGGAATATPTCQVLPPGIPGYRPYCPWTADPTPDGRWHAPDLPRARQLVRESGTTGMSVTMWTTPQPRIAVIEAQAVVDALNAIGYHATLRTLPDNTYFTYTNDSRNHAQAIDEGWSAYYPNANELLGKLTCRYFVPGNGVATTNATEFCDHAYDQDVTQTALLAESDPAAAEERWAQLDRQMTDLAIWLPTVTPMTVDLISDRVNNYSYHPVWGALIDQFWLR
jgi:ABC-type transport system substrate-binding protein/sugar lactone lactonase YvrE